MKRHIMYVSLVLYLIVHFVVSSTTNAMAGPDPENTMLSSLTAVFIPGGDMDIWTNAPHMLPDANSKAANHSSGQIAAGSIASTARTQGAAVETFRFSIQDMGTYDGLPTKVTTLRFINASPTSGADWTQNIAGVRLVTTTGPDISIGLPTITNSDITIPISSGDLVVADGGSMDLSLYVYLKSTGTVEDNKNLQFKIPATGHGWETDPSGSSAFQADFGADVSGNVFAITVSATKLSMAAPTVCFKDSAFSATISAMDSTNNIDIDNTASVTLSMSSGSGTLASIAGLTQSLVAGKRVWSDLSYNVFGLFKMQGTASGLTYVVSDDIDCVSAITVGTQSTSQRYPFELYYDCSRSASLYLSSEIPHMNLDHISYYVSAAQNTSSAKFRTRVSLMKTSATSLATSSWSALASGATQVYDNTRNWMNSGWDSLKFNTVFNFDTDNLLVLVEDSGAWLGMPNCPLFSYTSTSPTGKCAQTAEDSFPPTIVYSTYDRPDIRVSGNYSMEYLSSAVAQDTLPINAGGTQQRIARVRITTAGAGSPIGLQRLRLNLTGSSSIADDIDSVMVFYTGASPVFGTTNLFGSPVGGSALASNFDIGGPTAQTLIEGDNYFWIAVHVKATAIHADTVRVGCDSILIAGTNRVPAVTPATGTRNSNRIINKTVNTIVVTQASASIVVHGQKNAEILRLAFNVDGPSTGVLNLNTIQVIGQNQDDADVDSVKIFQTGASDTFSASSQVGISQALSSGTAAMGSLSYNLPAGTSYLWIAYDIATSPTNGDTVDVRIPVNGITVGINTYNFVVENPPGCRTVRALMSGTYTIGESGANYRKLNDIFNELCLAGVNGSVTILINGDYAPAGETFPILANAIPGADATWNIVLKPNTGVTASLIGSSTTSIFKLNGIDYLTIDGSNNGTTSRNLTLENTGAGTSSAVVWVSGPTVADPATNNTVKNCILKGSAFDQTLACIISCGSTISTASYPQSQNSFNTYLNNQCMKAQYGLIMIGPDTGSLDSNATVKDNLFGTAVSGEGFSVKGIMAKYQGTPAVDNNDVRNICNVSWADIMGISLEDCRGAIVSKNRVFGMHNTGSIGNHLYGISTFASDYTTVTNPSNNTFVNNMVYNLQSNGTSSTWTVSGINDNGGYNDRFYYNSVYLSDTLGGRQQTLRHSATAMHMQRRSRVR